MSEQEPKRRGRPPGPTSSTKVKKLELIHNGSLWVFAPGTRIRRVTLANKAWLVVVPANGESPFLIDNLNRKRTVTEDMHDALRKLATADITLDDLAAS
ncbi:MAG: hypothetical protein ACTIA6_03460 [Pseudoclavibacter sp.]